MRRVGKEEASHHYPASGTSLEADPMPLGLAEWRLEVSCWRPKLEKQKISRHRGGHEDKGVGSEVGSPPLCHPVYESRLAAMGQLSFSSLLVGCWCYVCRDTNWLAVSCYDKITSFQRKLHPLSQIFNISLQNQHTLFTILSGIN